MDNNFQILLGNRRNVDSINTNMSGKIELFNDLREITEYEVNDILSATEIFNNERESNPIYRIYGKMEYMSLLNGLKNNYSTFEDFFLPQYGNNSKNILNSFDFYLVRPSDTGYTKINDTTYVRCFKVVATPNDFELYPIGYANNVYGEQEYSFNFNVDINVSNYYDELMFPATELFLYAQYKPSTSPAETLLGTFWNNGVSGKTEIVSKSLNIGDIVSTATDLKICDLIFYDKANFYQNQYKSQLFYINTPYDANRLVWRYNPFIPIRLRYLTNDVYRANSGSSVYDVVQSIPPYATEYPENTGNFVWRNIMPEGYTDPLTGIGSNNPFVNKKRYVFSTIIFDVTPDLNDTVTRNAFSDVWFENNAIVSDITPISNINNIGKPCQ